MNQVIISVVTINFNDLGGLKLTYQSVIKQSAFDQIEWIIIDGKSGDGSTSFIQNEAKKYANKILIEPDTGIYNAMNKGLNLSTGDFVIMLNSGDTFSNEHLIQKVIESIHSLDIVYFGQSIMYDRFGNEWTKPSNKIHSLDKWIKRKLPSHQSVFIPKSFYKINYYDSFYRISGDSDYLSNAFSHLEFHYLNFPVTKFALGGISSNPKLPNLGRHIKERVIYSLKYEYYWPLRISYYFFVYPLKVLFNNILGQKFYNKVLKLFKNY